MDWVANQRTYLARERTLGRLAIDLRIIPSAGADDIGNQSCFFKSQNRQPANIDFPPFVTMSGSPLICVVIIVPALSVSDQTDQPIVSTIVIGFVVSIPPNMSDRIDTPCDVPI